MAPGPEPLVVVAVREPAAPEALGSVPYEWGCRVAVVGEAGRVAAALAAEPVALLLLDPGLEPDSGVHLLSAHPGLPVVLLVEPDRAPALPEALRRGAFDYLPWPPDPQRLRVVLAHAVERHRLLDRIRRLEEAAAPPPPGSADADLRAIDRLEKRAIVDALGRAGGHVRKAARLLGLGQATVYRKIKRYSIRLPGRDPPAGEGEVNAPHPDPARSGD